MLQIVQQRFQMILMKEISDNPSREFKRFRLILLMDKVHTTPDAYHKRSRDFDGTHWRFWLRRFQMIYNFVNFILRFGCNILRNFLDPPSWLGMSEIIVKIFINSCCNRLKSLTKIVWNVGTNCLKSPPSETPPKSF